MKSAACTALIAVGCIGLEFRARDTSPDPDDTSPEELNWGDLRVYPAAVDFGEVEVGRSEPATVILSYSGTGDMIVSDAAVTGGAGTIVIANVTGLPVAVLEGSDVVVDLLFSPAAPREYTGQLGLVTDHAEAGTVEVPLSGLGVDDGGGPSGADISVAPTSIDFGLVDVASSNLRTLTVSNIGSESLFLNDIQVGDAALEWEFEQYLPIEFDPGEAREVSLTWRPTSVGSLSSWIRFTSDCAGEELVEIPVAGEADDICDVCAPMISVDTGGDAYAMSFMSFSFLGPDTQAVRVTNSGDEPLTLRDVYVNNDLIWTAGTFSTDWGGAAVTLDPWDSHDIRVSYLASGTALDMPAEAFDMNILHILSDAANEPDYAIALTGTGI